MGHKVHPYGFRIGIIRGWHSKWFSEKNYSQFLGEDLKLHQTVESKCADGAVAKVEIERQSNEILVTLYSARPGIIIGRGGQKAEEIRAELEKVCGKKVRLTIKEVEQPALVACLIARGIAEQLERRVSFRRAMKQTLFRVMQAGAKGVKITCAGRLDGAEIARRYTIHQGQLPLHTLQADIDYGFAKAHTLFGLIGVKVWVYKGDILLRIRRESVTAETSQISQSS